MTALRHVKKLTIQSLLPATPENAAALAIAIPSVLVLLLCTFFSLRWETNDDVAMSMIAHGYGAIAYASPRLVFSNVLWGHFVNSIPSVHGIVGYSIATMGILVVTGIAILYGLLLQGSSLLAGSLVIGLALVRAILFPQFTINSGLLAVAGVVLLMAYQRHPDRLPVLFFAIALMFVSFLVRWIEFAFVMLVALPFLNISQLRNSRPTLVAFATLALACGAALLIDDAAYQGSEWQAFNALNPVRVLFTDYGIEAHFAAKPDSLSRYGLSINDLRLLSKFYFLDPQLSDPRVLRALLHELPGLFDPLTAIDRGIRAFAVLFRAELFPIFLAAALLFVVNPRWSTALSWLIFLAAVMMLGAMGRPGVTRIFYAPLVMLVIGSALDRSLSSLHRKAQVAVLVCAFAANAAITMSLASTTSKEMKIVQASLAKLPSEPIVVWGRSLPYQLAYPVLSTPPLLTLQALGSFSLAPYSNLVKSEQKGRGPLHLLKTGQTVRIVADKEKMELFSEYARTRLHASPIIHRHSGIRKIPLNTVRLEPTGGAGGIGP